MAHSNVDTIEIKERVVYDGRKPLKVFDLCVDGCHRASVSEQRTGMPRFRFDPVGAFDWQEAQVWLQGLLELSIYAEELARNVKEK